MFDPITHNNNNNNSNNIIINNNNSRTIEDQARVFIITSSALALEDLFWDFILRD